MAYKPSDPFNVKFKLIQVETKETLKGYEEVEIEEENPTFLLGSFKTYGGTDVIINNAMVVEDTGVIYTYYNRNIKTNSKLLDVETGIKYNILGRPENIERRNQFMIIRVRAI